MWGTNDVPRYTIFQRIDQAIVMKEKEKERERQRGGEGGSSVIMNMPYADWKSGIQGKYVIWYNSLCFSSIMSENTIFFFFPGDII